MQDHAVRSAAAPDVLDAVLAAYRQALENADVNSDDDFFEIGGDSVQALNVIAILEDTLGLQISAARFFSCPTAAELARAIQAPNVPQ
jgi:acyl carrier protein